MNDRDERRERMRVSGNFWLSARRDDDIQQFVVYQSNFKALKKKSLQKQKNNNEKNNKKQTKKKSRFVPHG